MAKNLFLLICGLIFIVNSESIFSLSIKEMIRTEKEKVFLADIIETDDFDMKKKSKNIQVAYSPEPGEESRIKGDYIKLKIKQLDFNLEGIIFPEEIIILREYELLSLETLQKIIEGKIKEYYSDDSLLINIELKEKEDLKLPLGKLGIDINDYRVENEKLGKYSVGINLTIDSTYYKKISVNLEVGKMQKSYVLKEAVNRGDLFIKDLVIEKDELIHKEFQINDEEMNIEDIEGEIFKRNMRVGEKIDINDFEKRKIFKRNEKIIIYMNYNGIKLKSRGKALEDGYEGEEVRVLNEKSKKVINGKVKIDGTVEIELY